jgi:hypothetical protein
VSVAPVLDPLPDAERLTSSFLRSNARIASLVGERVFTAFPKQEGPDALLIVQRVGGEPPFSIPLVADAAQLQLDAYGGTKLDAWTLIALTRAVLTELEGAVRPEGVVSAVRFGALRWIPDETYSPPRPRYVADVTLTVRTPVVPGDGLTESTSLVSDATRASA